MDFLFYQVAAINGFDSLGHYLRAGLIVNTCSHVLDPTPTAGLLGELQRRRARHGVARRRPSRTTQALARTATRAARRAGGAGAGAADRAGDRRGAHRRRRRPRRRSRHAAAARRPQALGAPSRCSTTCSEATADEPPRLGLRSRPTRCSSARRRCSSSSSPSSSPTTPTPACRSCPTYDAQGRACPTRPTSSRATTCGSAARASGAVTDDRAPAPAATARSPPSSTLKLETHGQAAAGRLDGAHPPALGARPQVRRAHARATPSAGFDDGATIPLRHGAARRRSSSTRSSTCSTSRRARPRSATCSASATRSPAAARDLNQAIERAQPAAARPRPGRAQPRRAPTRGSRGFCDALGRTARDRRAGGRGAGRRCSCNLDTTFTRAAPRSRARSSRSRSPAGPPTLDDGDPRASRASGRSWPTAQALFRELRPGVGALRAAAPDLADALAVGTPTLPKTLGRVQPAPRSRPSRRCERFAEDPLVHARRPATSPSTATIAGRRRSLTSTPAQTVCNYVTLCFRNVGERCSASATRNGTWQRFIIIATPQGPNNEGDAVLRARPTAPGSREPPALQPLPEHGLAGPAERVRGRQRALPAPASTVIGNAPGTQARDDRDDDAGMRRRGTTRRPARAAQGPHGR